MGKYGLDVTSFGTRIDEIIEIIRHKEKKNKNKNWGKVEERWLLISATGETMAQTGHISKERINWQSSKLHELCASSKFDRIYFWDARFDWYKKIKPNL